jgi:two-component system NtrC family sensor kinase
VTNPVEPAGAAKGHDITDLAGLVHSAKLVSLGMLVAGVAHELNTPLGALSSNHDVLRRALGRLQDILADEVVEPHELDEVRRVVAALNGVMRVNDLAVDRMRHLVASLRSFGRPDQAEIDRIDVHEAIDATLILLRHEMKDRIRVQREFGELPHIECHPQQLGQVFMNLLMNAIQAIRDTGTITVRTRSTAEGIAVDVEDTGTGIAPEHHTRLFEPGFTTKGSRVGMGLGLLITQQIVETHGGRITVNSEVGRGSTFTVHLPRRLPEQRSSVGRSPPA